MKTSFGLGFACLLAGCTATAPPEVTPEMARTSSRGPVTVAQLQHGRVLFASRCIECHILPPVTAHNDTAWPHLVHAMAKRASLKPSEQEAILAYILAARAHSPASE